MHRVFGRLIIDFSRCSSNLESLLKSISNLKVTIQVPSLVKLTLLKRSSIFNLETYKFVCINKIQRNTRWLEKDSGGMIYSSLSNHCRDGTSQRAVPSGRLPLQNSSQIREVVCSALPMWRLPCSDVRSSRTRATLRSPLQCSSIFWEFALRSQEGPSFLCLN